MDFNYTKHFKPMQPKKLWSKDVKENIIYREYYPCNELRPFIACLWTCNSIGSIKEPIYYRIIPDGCIDIVFNLNRITTGEYGSVVGLMNSPEKIKMENIIDLVGVRFWPAGAVPFLNISVFDFTDDAINLKSILGKEALALCDEIYNLISPERRVKVIENKLKSLLKDVKTPDKLIQQVLYKILKNGGNVVIKELVAELDITQRSLTRKFKKWIGTSPKTFSRIIKFQNIIYELNRVSEVEWSNFALENGYYDQSHLIREFKSFYGLTPDQLF